MLAKPLAACTYLSSTVSQLFQPQVQNIAVFTYRSPHFCFHWRRPCDYHATCCMDGKSFQCLPNSLQHVPIYLEYFPSYTMLNSMLKSKNRYFYHIFVSPGDAPGAITLNVVCMEREFDAYKLSRCMWPSNYYRFWDTARYLWKNSHSTPPLGGFPSEYRHPLWYGNTRMVSLPDGEKISKICLFVLTWSTNVTDGLTDRQTPGDSKDRAYASHRAVKISICWSRDCNRV